MVINLPVEREYASIWVCFKLNFFFIYKNVCYILEMEVLLTTQHNPFHYQLNLVLFFSTHFPIIGFVAEFFVRTWRFNRKKRKQFKFCANHRDSIAIYRLTREWNWYNKNYPNTHPFKCMRHVVLRWTKFRFGQANTVPLIYVLVFCFGALNAIQLIRWYVLSTFSPCE